MTPEIIAAIEQIKNETQPNANSAARISNALELIANNNFYAVTAQQLELLKNLITPTDTDSSQVTFDILRILNNSSTPSTSNVTVDLTDARKGLIQKFYSNKSVEPTYPSGFVKVSGNYTPSALNIIYFEWCGGTRVEYWIANPTA